MAVSDNVVHSGTAADTTLASDITSGSTSLTLTSGTGFPSPTGGQIAYLVLAPGTAAEEVVSYTARSGANVTGVTRGLHGTSASSHVAGKTVRHQWTAGESDDVIKATLNTLGRITAIGDTLYADSTTTLARLAKGTSGQFLKQGASIPAWASLSTADLSDVDLVGISTGAILYWNGTDLVDLAAGTNGHVLTLAAGVPSWAAASSTSPPANDSSEVSTSQTTTSASFTDLATAGPAVTVTTGTKALVTVTANLTNNTAGAYAYMAFAVSGATTLAAGNGRVLQYAPATGGIELTASATFILEGLTAGSNTFTAKYAVGTNTATFKNRHIAVVNMGS